MIWPQLVATARPINGILVNNARIGVIVPRMQGDLSRARNGIRRMADATMFTTDDLEAFRTSRPEALLARWQDVMAEREREVRITRSASSRLANGSATRLRRRGVVTRMRQVFTVALVGFAALLGGCGEHSLLARFQLVPEHIIVECRADAAYEGLFPYYVELCAASQYQSKITGEWADHPAMRSFI